MSEESSSATRESIADESTAWQKNSSGPSVPFFSTLKPLPEPQSSTHVKAIADKLEKLSFALNNSNSPPSETEEEIVERKGKRPMLSKKKPDFSFVFTPPPPIVPTLTTHQLSPTDSGILNDVPVHEDIRNTLNECVAYTSSDEAHLATTVYTLEGICPPTEWYSITQLDLSRQSLVSFNCSFFPYLEILKMSHNELTRITTLPETLHTLNVSHNRLNHLQISHLFQLQYLFIGDNHIDQLDDLNRLTSLRVLNADNNMISDCKQFQSLSGLLSLSLKGNNVERLNGFDGNNSNHCLETMDLSANRIKCLDSLHVIKNLRELNLDNNNIKWIQLDQPMTRLCKLKLSFNRLRSFDMSSFPDIRVLYLDDNQIQRIIGLSCISRLDSLSMRDQGNTKIEFNLQHIRGIRKLYLSGSPITQLHQMMDFYSLEYLELCSANIEVLPVHFSKQVPNLGTLYLSMNRIHDIRPLRKLKYLRKLILFDNRITNLNEVISVMKNLKRLNYLDLR
ncbi:hypothetical protein BDB01DRAFT_805100 [Pilobolus umbonatus]|nr:hypothetical protein BDB01DRAFT_805100 [Pilobolus umbonatus]